MKLISKIKRILKNNPLRLRLQYALQIIGNRKLRQRIKYTKMFERCKLSDTAILYESHHGNSMSCNPYAIFKAISEDPDYSHFTHIWVLNDLSKAKPKYKTAKNIRFIKHDSREYYRYLAQAKYLISNTTFPQFFIRKSEQTYLNTWHGTPLKTIGKEIKNNVGRHANWQRNLLQATHIIHPNKFTANYIKNANDIEGFCKAKISESGYPRQDLTLNTDATSIRKQLNIEPNKKIVLWAPTWRGSIRNVNLVDIDRFISEYKYMQESLGDEYVILPRVHHLISKAMSKMKFESFLVDETIDTNELLAATDILITDYSSIAVDFLVTGRPIVLYCYDLECYEKMRGFAFDLLQMPAPLCRTIEQAVQAVQNAQASTSLFESSYKECQNLFTYLDDGAATQRAIDFMFNKKAKGFYYLNNDKMNLLFYCGAFVPNGVTSSALSLLNNLDPEKYNIAVMVATSNFRKKRILKNPAILENISLLDEHIKIYFRSTNEMYGTTAEIIEKMYSFAQGIFPNAQKVKLLQSIYQREFQRLFGDTHFDVGFDFSGYHPDWASLIAFGGAHGKIIYLHSDMLADSMRKINGEKIFAQAFNITFSLYHYFDKLISVSRLSCERNKDKLTKTWHVPASKFTYLNNAIDHQVILENARTNNTYELFGEGYYIKHKYEESYNIDIKAIRVPCPSLINFAIVGRLSPEKGHERLIHAFERALELNANIRLHIIGDGPLMRNLKQLCAQKRLEAKVIFTGNLSNPFAYLKLCDCLISASKYEGQGLALLEALVLGKAIFATKTTGSISVLKEGGYGEIVPNSKDGLYSGFEKYLRGEITPKKFDYVSYNSEAIKMFDNLFGEDKKE